MRKINAPDLFKALRIIKAVEAKQELAQFADRLRKRDGITETSEIGMELILGLMANCSSAEAEGAIYDFLSGPLELEVEAIKHMDLIKLMEYMREAFALNDPEEWRTFFTSLADLMARTR